MIKEEMPRMVDLVVTKDREITPRNVQELISNEFTTHGPKMIEVLFQKYMQNTTLNLYHTSSTPNSSTATMSTADLQYQLHLNMKLKPQDFSLIMMNNIRILILLKGGKRAKSIRDARRVIDSMCERDELSLWRLMMKGYVDNGDAGAGLLLFGQMKELRLSLDGETFRLFLLACDGVC
nr:pentatricopeptide repeat-containing protein At2g15690-like [Tanacetum cinerariifolium]